MTSRLGWLDALRGAAALAVALHHASYVYLPSLRIRVADWFDPGMAGVLVFFLVSGYIVPASLERRGSVRGFWIGRFFRIYPLLAVACLLAVLPFLLGVLGLRAGLEQYSPATAVLAHLTMLQDVLNVPNVMNVLWTLSYEMAFYLLIVALFVVGGHRRSAPAAAVLTV
ncbi:MAG: acyltransferase family protein, partial [Spirillospora sp.]